MLHLPLYVYITFGATILFGSWLFLKATNYSRSLFLLFTVWLAFQSILGMTGFYNDPGTMTARFPLLIAPPLIFLAATFMTKKGKAFIDSLDVPTLTLFHVIRIPVEIVLFWLFVYNTIPEAMTFHGKNFDIFSGLSAPLIYYFGFVKNKISKAVIISWNLVSLALLLLVVSNALLSLPGRFEKFGFEQANTALRYFPFLLLPTCLVPMVMCSTLASIRQLLKKA